MANAVGYKLRPAIFKRFVILVQHFFVGIFVNAVVVSVKTHGKRNADFIKFFGNGFTERKTARYISVRFGESSHRRRPHDIDVRGFHIGKISFHFAVAVAVFGHGHFFRMIRRIVMTAYTEHRLAVDV